MDLGLGEALLGQSQEVAKYPPRSPPSGFLVDASAQPVVGKPSPWFPLASSCSRTPDEALDRRIGASKVQSLHNSELGSEKLASTSLDTGISVGVHRIGPLALPSLRAHGRRHQRLDSQWEPGVRVSGPLQYEPFILAAQAQQVYFTAYPNTRTTTRSELWAVCKVEPRLYPDYEVEEDHGHCNDEFFQLDDIDDFSHGHGGMLELQDDIRLCNDTKIEEVEVPNLCLRLQHNLHLRLQLCLQDEVRVTRRDSKHYKGATLVSPQANCTMEGVPKGGVGQLIPDIFGRTSHHFATERKVADARTT
ncbi:hypothetical protein Taro_021175 [Colocasia esculenta]|uniref:Uncharacterized protein n=1 Tax=Colocasia esculenta TaxID=4460 RepID=A0A843UY87_COLES|nr:hypothetical protein [Colocasia esculenta]